MRCFAIFSLLLGLSATVLGSAVPGYSQSVHRKGGTNLIYLNTPREGVLQNPRVHSNNVRSYNGKSAANPYNTDSGLPYGASAERYNDLVFVLPREAVPMIAINPWDPITDRTIDRLRRNYPWIRRTDSVRQDLIAAQNQYLRERGYVDSVRSFTSQRPQVEIPSDYLAEDFNQTKPDTVEQPRQSRTLIIRAANTEDLEIPQTLNEGSVIRVRPSADQPR